MSESDTDLQTVLFTRLIENAKEAARKLTTPVQRQEALEALDECSGLKTLEDYSTRIEELNAKNAPSHVVGIVRHVEARLHVILRPDDLLWPRGPDPIWEDAAKIATEISEVSSRRVSDIVIEREVEAGILPHDRLARLRSSPYEL